MEKEVKLAHERRIKIVIGEDNNKKITEYFSADGLDCAHYSFEQGEEVRLSARLDIDFTSEENKNQLMFSIDVDHPLYFPLLHLLNGESELIIDDEDKANKNIKYLSIKNEDDFISLNFVDKNKNERMSDRFSIHYDNKKEKTKRMYLLKKSDYKKRVEAFFDEASELLLEDYHQINFEEYTVRQKILRIEHAREQQRNIS